MSIRLKKPYKITQWKLKRYHEHYDIPSEKCVIIPIVAYGDDISCDVRWEDNNGEMQYSKLFFNHENIEPLNEFKDTELYDIWQHYYNSN